MSSTRTTTTMQNLQFGRKESRLSNPSSVPHYLMFRIRMNVQFPCFKPRWPGINSVVRIVFIIMIILIPMRRHGHLTQTTITLRLTADLDPCVYIMDELFGTYLKKSGNNPPIQFTSIQMRPVINEKKKIASNSNRSTINKISTKTSNSKQTASVCVCEKASPEWGYFSRIFRRTSFTQAAQSPADHT